LVDNNIEKIIALIGRINFNFTQFCIKYYFKLNSLLLSDYSQKTYSRIKQKIKLQNMRTILITFLILSSCSANSQTVIKMERDAGLSTIPCKVNGLHLRFIFDTRAGDVSISLAEATFMLRNRFFDKNDFMGTTNYKDANGNIYEGIKINIKEIEIAGLKLRNVTASIVKNLQAPLLLGQSTISKLGTIQLDLNSNTLTILNGKNVFDYSEKSINTEPDKDIDKLIVAEKDFTKRMTWLEAIAACSELGSGWRLPTISELKKIYLNKEKYGIFVLDGYWSSSDGEGNKSWLIDFYNGRQYLTAERKNEYYIRAVKIK